MIEQLIAEATECDFKVALEIKKPKSWLKSVSSFSNGIGGTLFNQLLGFFISSATLKSHSVASAISCSIIKSLL